MSDTALLPIAQRVLAELPFFGLVEQMDASRQLLRQVFRFTGTDGCRTCESIEKR